MLRRHRDWVVPVVCFAGAAVTALAVGPHGRSSVEEAVAPAVMAPPLAVDELTKQVGDLLPNESKPVKYRVTNTSNEVLHLAKISTSCSCIAASFEKADLEPHESTHVAVVLKAGQQLGKLTASLEVLFYLSSDQKLQRQTLFATGRVCSIIETEPNEVAAELRESPAGDEECVVIAFCRREPSTKVTGAHCSHPGVRVTAIRANADGRTEIRLRFDHDKFYIPVTKAQLILYTDNPLQEAHPVDVTIRKQP
jgi:hypothetical protein